MFLPVVPRYAGIDLAQELGVEPVDDIEREAVTGLGRGTGRNFLNQAQAASQVGKGRSWLALHGTGDAVRRKSDREQEGKIAVTREKPAIAPNGVGKLCAINNPVAFLGLFWLVSQSRLRSNNSPWAERLHSGEKSTEADDCTAGKGAKKDRSDREETGRHFASSLFLLQILGFQK